MVLFTSVHQRSVSQSSFVHFSRLCILATCLLALCQRKEVMAVVLYARSKFVLLDQERSERARESERAAASERYDVQLPCGGRAVDDWTRIL